MPLRWKVCGTTNSDDALAAVEAGADAIGFVFYSPSPRAVEPSAAAAIARRLPSEIWRIGVFVDATVSEMSAVVDAVGLDFLQLSGDESPSLCSDLTRHAFKALRLRPGTGAEEALELAERYSDCTLLVDAVSGGLYGGSGRVADWNAAAALAQRHRLMLAGGLTAHSVREAVETVRPWAVDVASGVESRPGIKDHEKLRAFARALEPFR